MRLTLANVLDLDLLRDAEAELVAGADQLEREVRWVHISEQPDVARYLKGGELLFTTGMGLGLNEGRQTRYVTELAKAGIAGLVIRLGGTWKQTPRGLADQAAKLDLPLIVLHRRIGLIDLTEHIHGAIINRQYELLTRAESIGRGFTDLFMRGADLAHILEELVRIVQNPVVLEDPAHQLLDFVAHGHAAENVLTAWAAHSRGDGLDPPDAGVAMGESPLGLWADIWIRDELWARLHVFAWDRPLDEIDEVAVDRAVAAVALALLAEAESHSRTDRARDNLIADILGDRHGGVTGFFSRAESCRAHFQERRLVAMALAPFGLTAILAAEQASESEGHQMRRRLQQEMQRALEATGAVALSGLDGDTLLAVVGIEPRKEPRAALDEAGGAVCDRIIEFVDGIVPVVGVSTEASPKSLRQAFGQAMEAASCGRGRSEPTVVHFADLGLHHLLVQLSEGPELARFVEAELSPLLEYDAKRRTRLVATLRAYLDCGANKSRAAEVLFIERRSLYHRLDRIQDVLHVDLADQETSLRLRVALRGLELLGQRSRAV